VFYFEIYFSFLLSKHCSEIQNEEISHEILNRPTRRAGLCGEAPRNSLALLCMRCRWISSLAVGSDQ